MHMSSILNFLYITFNLCQVVFWMCKPGQWLAWDIETHIYVTTRWEVCTFKKEKCIFWITIGNHQLVTALQSAEIEVIVL